MPVPVHIWKTTGTYRRAQRALQTVCRAATVSTKLASGSVFARLAVLKFILYAPMNSVSDERPVRRFKRPVKQITDAVSLARFEKSVVRSEIIGFLEVKHPIQQP